MQSKVPHFMLFRCFSCYISFPSESNSSAIPPKQIRCKLGENPFLHRLCTDFGTEEGEGSTKVLPFYFLLNMRVIHPPCKRISPFNIIIKSEREIQNQGNLLDMLTNLCQIALHSVCILMIDDIEKFLQLITNLRNLIMSVRVEKDFLKQIVILTKHAFSNTHVTLEGGTWGVLWLHNGSKHEC